MQLDRSLRKCSVTAIGAAALAVSIGVVAATLTTVTLGAIALSEVFTFAILIVFTMLIWAAIQDGKSHVLIEFED
jgi:hypothetical protein